MIDYQGSLEAELWHALSISRGDATLALEAALRSRRWRDAPTAWVEVARRVAGRDGEALIADLYSKLAATLRAGELKNPEREAVLLVVGGLRWTESAGELDETLRWLASRASPGDAATVVAVLGSIWWNERNPPEVGRALPASAFVLVEWLLQSGASELRMHGSFDPHHPPSSQQHRNAQHFRGADLLFRIAEATNVDGRRHNLITALRYLFDCEHADGGRQQGSAEQIWRLTERGLELGMDSGTVVDDALRLLRAGRHGEQGRWLPLDKPTEFPRAAAALAAAVASARFDEHLTIEAGRHIYSCAPPDEVEPRVATTLTHAAGHEQRGMGHHSFFGNEPAPPAPRTQRIAAWMRVISRSVAPVLDARYNDSQLARTLRSIAGDHADIANEMVAGFAEVLPSGTVAGDLARTTPANAALVDGIISVLTSPRAGTRPRVAADLSALSATLARMINFSWFDPVGGIDLGSIFKRVDRVELTALPDGRAVVIDGTTLRVDDDFPQRLFAKGETPRAMLGSMLYIAHEVAHLAQGFAGLDVVAKARAIGAETTILQIDLAADHAAALVARRVLPNVDLIHAKDVNSRGQLTFAVGDFHTEASRQRKAVRFASARFDIAARAHWTTSATDDGFFMLDFAPGGDTCLAFFSDRCLRLVSRPLALSGFAREALLTSVDSGSTNERIARVDEVVKELADLAWRVRSE